MTTDSKKQNAANAEEAAGSVRKPWSAPRVIESTNAKNSSGGHTFKFGYDAHVGTTTTVFS